MLAQLPGYVDGNGTAHGNKFWPAFWLAYSLENAGCRIYHDEIDIMDQCCDTYYDAKTIGSGANKWDGQCSFYSVCKTTRTNATPLCNSFHKYAMEWNVNKVVFYFDDVPYLESYAPFTTVPMQLLIDLQINSDYGFDVNPVAAQSPGLCHTIDFDPN
ncbi:MAG: family 16 glycosylhydrolase, partial [Bacteroidia bacterium]